jgi:hypothetical protein
VNLGRFRRSLGPLAAVAALALGCGRDEELAAYSLEPPVELGGVCGTSGAYCIGETRLLRCKNRFWTEVSCSAICAETGRIALGCHDRAYGDDCVCASIDGSRIPDAPPCAASRQCKSQDSILYCDRNGAREASCADVCGELTPPRRSEGCRAGVRGASDDCACTIAGMPCGDVFTAVCDGPSHLLRCVDGIWQLSDCAEECTVEQSASCGSWAGDAGAACRCGNPA